MESWLLLSQLWFLAPLHLPLKQCLPPSASPTVKVYIKTSKLFLILSFSHPVFSLSTSSPGSTFKIRHDSLHIKPSHSDHCPPLPILLLERKKALPVVSNLVICSQSSNVRLKVNILWWSWSGWSSLLKPLIFQTIECSSLSCWRREAQSCPCSAALLLCVLLLTIGGRENRLIFC